MFFLQMFSLCQWLRCKWVVCANGLVTNVQFVPMTLLQMCCLCQWLCYKCVVCAKVILGKLYTGSFGSNKINDVDEKKWSQNI